MFFFLLKNGVYSSLLAVSWPEGICQHRNQQSGLPIKTLKGMVRADTLLERIHLISTQTGRSRVSLYTYFRFLGPAALNPVRVRVGKYSLFLLVWAGPTVCTHISRIWKVARISATFKQQDHLETQMVDNFVEQFRNFLFEIVKSWCEFGEGIARRVCWILDEHTDVFLKQEALASQGLSTNSLTSGKEDLRYVFFPGQVGANVLRKPPNYYTMGAFCILPQPNGANIPCSFCIRKVLK